MTGQTELLLGDNPFNRVDHLSQERSRSRQSLDKGDIADIISTAIESGATGLTFSTTPKMLEVLSHMKVEGFSKKIRLYPLIPDVSSYFQLVSEKGMLGALMGKLSELNTGSKVRSILGGGWGLMARDPERILRAYVKAEGSLVEAVLPIGAGIESVFLHEIGTDLMVSLNMTSLFETYCRIVEDGLNVAPGFVTRNFPRFINFIRGNDFGLKEYFVLTPFNSMGFQMNPNRQDCETALGDAKGANVIAMSILAGGYLGLDDAVQYIVRLPSEVSCVVGVSTTSHARETFSTLREKLQR
jgi:hypothetical protein